MVTTQVEVRFGDGGEMMRTLSLGVVSLCLLGFVGQAQAHGDEDHSKKPAPAAKVAAKGSAALAETTAPQRLSDGSVFVSKAVQRQLGLRTVLSVADQLPQTLELNGSVVADPNAGGRVQASQAGRVELVNASLPALGQRVVKGQVLAYLRPVMSSLDRGNAQSILADISAQLSIADAKLRRYEQLADALPKATVEAARYDVDALKKRQASVTASLHSSETLLAPVSGVISAAHVMAGQVVDAKETLFEIIDPARLMVEALAYDPILVGDIADASAASAQGKHSAALQLIGGGQQLREQALPLLFKVKNAASQFVAGQAVKVFVQTKSELQGYAIPASAVVRLSGGETVVWVHTEAERFVQKKVQAQALNGHQFAVLSGLHEDERVVVSGASLLAQIK